MGFLREGRRRREGLGGVLGTPTLEGWGGGGAREVEVKPGVSLNHSDMMGQWS